MSIVKTIIACAFVMLAMVNPSQARGWRGIVPLYSTRVDVEKVLGVPKESRGVSAIYDTKDEKVTVSYSDGSCKEDGSGDWNVPRDTVISFTVSPKAKLLVAELKLDKTKYTRVHDLHTSLVVYYFNREAGIRISARMLEDGEDVDSITYEPAAADEHLLCPDAHVTLYGAKNSRKKEETTIPSLKEPIGCDAATTYLDFAVIDTLKLGGAYLIIIARLGTDETSRRLNQHRLSVVEEHVRRRGSDLKYVLAEGSRVKGLGHIELYVGGRLSHILPLKKNAKGYCLSRSHLINDLVAL